MTLQFARRTELTNKQNQERKDLDTKYQPKSLLKKLLGAAIGIAISMFVVYYNVNKGDMIEECHKIDSEPYPYGYCILRHPKSKSNKTILYNPGTLEGDSFLRSIESTKGTKDHEEFLKAFTPEEMPTIISFNTYPSALEEKENVLDAKQGALDLYTEPRLRFIREVVLLKLLGVERVPHSIALMGTSRGGWNTLQILHSMPELWSKVLISSPLLSICDPFEPAKVNGLKLTFAILTQNWAMIPMAFEQFPCVAKMEHPGKTMNGFGSQYMLKAYYKTKDAYDKANPFNWISEFPKDTPIMITEALQDDFPFLDPGRQYSNLLKNSGVKVEYIEVEGKHGRFSASTMKDFVLK